MAMVCYSHLYNQITMKPHILAIFVYLFPISSSIQESKFPTTEELHLTRCVKHILYKHIEPIPGNLVLISLPFKEYDTGQYALQYLLTTQIADYMMYSVHEELIWPLQVVFQSDNSQDQEYTDRKDGICCYIIFAWSSDDHTNTIDSIIYQMGGLATSTSWNPQALFIIALTDKVVRTPKDVTLKILRELWISYKVLNSLILINPLTESHNVFEIYSWFPFRDQNKCDNVQESVILDRWSIDAKGKFVEENNLLPNKIPSNLHGCPLQVAVLSIKPYSEIFPTYQKDINKTVYIIDGYDGNVLLMIFQVMNISLQPTADSLTNTNVSLFQRASQALSNLMFGAELAVGSLPIHPVAAYYVEFTFQYQESIFKWFVPCPKPYSRLEKITRIFSIMLWITILLIFIFGSFFLWILAKYCKTMKMKELQTYAKLSNCFCYLLSVTLGISVWKMPCSSALRSFFIAFIFYCFSIGIIFQTYFTSFLVNPGFHKAIKTMEDLLSSSLDYGYDEIFDFFVEGTYPKKASDHRIKCSQDECFHRYLKDDFATPGTDFHTKYLLLKSGSNKLICSLEENVVSKTSTFYLRKGSPFKEIFSKIIMHMTQGGILKKIEDDYLFKVRMEHSEIRNKFYEDNVNNNDYFVFTTSHLQVAFYILYGGYTLSCVQFLCEILYMIAIHIYEDGFKCSLSVISRE
ncbi:Ionotropic receptor 249 [Blattella germanica]|nr:Ionotropic receptor 249 [Blattella germanica]